MQIRFLAFAVISSVCAPLSHAQIFGSGIVYDPTQSAHAIHQIEQASRLYTTAVATRNQIVAMYNLAYQMSRMPQNLAARYRAEWAEWTSLQSTPNTYGNTSTWVDALNYGTFPLAQLGYNRAYVQAQSYPSGSYSSLNARTQAIVAHQYATAEIAQSATTSALATLGTIRSTSQAFAQKLANLASDTFSTDPSQQTENALLGKINSAALLQIHSQQNANQLLAASVQQQLLAQKQQIDAQNRAINNAIYFQQNFPNVMQQTTGGMTQAIQSISLSPATR
jgi:hypothetical protein